MITIRIKPARQWFKRKQWKFEIVGGNGEPIDPRDTYANVGDIRAAILSLVSPNFGDAITLEVHYQSGVQRELLRAEPGALS